MYYVVRVYRFTVFHGNAVDFLPTSNKLSCAADSTITILVNSLLRYMNPQSIPLQDQYDVILH